MIQKFPKSVSLYSNLSLEIPVSQKVTLTYDLSANGKFVEEKKKNSEVFDFVSTTNRNVAFTFPK